MFIDRLKSKLGLTSTQQLASASGQVRKPAAPSPSHVLLVLDSADSAAVLRAILERKGFTTTSTRFANEGLQQLRRLKKQSPIAVILDEDAIHHPTVGAEYEALTQNDSIQLFVLGKLRAKSDRSQNYVEISKPFRYDTLIRKIEKSSLIRFAA